MIHTYGAQSMVEPLVEILRSAGAEVIDHPEPQPERADSIFVFDPVIVTNQGAVILRMGKELRRGEEAALARRRPHLPDAAGLARWQLSPQRGHP